MDARATYIEGKEKRSREQTAEESRSRLFSGARLLVMFLALGFLGVMIWGPDLPRVAWWLEFALGVLFAVLVVAHAKVLRQKDRAQAAVRFHERGLARLDGKWHDFPNTGERFRSAEHPFSGDLDIYGKASLFQRIDATETSFGEQRLAEALGRTELGQFPNDIEARQQAIVELASRVGFRESLSLLGSLLSLEKPDPLPFVRWAEGSRPFSPNVVVVWLARIIPVVLVIVAMITSAKGWPWLVISPLVLIELILIAQTRASVSPIAAIVSARELGMAGYTDLLESIENEAFTSPLLIGLQTRLRKTGRSATDEMRLLSRILSFLDARNNEVFRFFIGPFLLWDLNCVIQLEAWRQRTGSLVRGWLDVLGELEALASLAGFAFENPDYVLPRLEREPVLQAKALAHPLLPRDRRVANDVTLHGAGFGLIVTGSNMSGKSTLLRAMGVNAVLALSGAPVCASELRLGPVRVVTSMRISDSLEHGVSHFYAELQKLKRVVDMARICQGGRVLFLLDEILHGTNSRERIIGARAIIKELLAQGALGAVSTHDLGISDLEAELRGKVKNVHFEEQVEGDKMTFDYRLREGVVKSSNALRLMKMVGIDVV